MNDWYDAERCAQEAKHLFEAGQWDEALRRLRQALSVDPTQGDWHYGVGLILEAMGRFDEAILSLEQAIRIHGESVEVMLRLGENLCRTHQHRRALEVFERVSQLDPDCEAGYCHRVEVYTELGEHDLAEQMFYMARQVTDRCARCSHHIARSLAARQQLDRAIWCWQEALRIDPRFVEAHAHLAQAHWLNGQQDQARRDYLDHLRHDPGNVDSLLQLGALLITLDRPGEAREKFHRVIELDPTIAEAHYYLGELALQAGHIESAHAQLEMADRLDPTQPGVHLALARAALKQGRNEQARTHLREEMQRDGRTHWQTLELARLLIDQRMAPQGAEVLSILTQQPRPEGVKQEYLAVALFYEGAARMLMGQLDEGVRRCREALRLGPKNVMVMQNIVLASLAQGRVQRAGAWLRRAMSIEPKNPKLRRLRYRLWRARLGGLCRRGTSKIASHLRLGAVPS